MKNAIDMTRRDNLRFNRDLTIGTVHIVAVDYRSYWHVCAVSFDSVGESIDSIEKTFPRDTLAHQFIATIIDYLNVRAMGGRS